MVAAARSVELNRVEFLTTQHSHARYGTQSGDGSITALGYYVDNPGVDNPGAVTYGSARVHPRTRGGAHA